MGGKNSVPKTTKPPPNKPINSNSTGNSTISNQSNNDFNYPPVPINSAELNQQQPIPESFTSKENDLDDEINFLPPQIEKINLNTNNESIPSRVNHQYDQINPLNTIKASNYESAPLNSFTILTPNTQQFDYRTIEIHPTRIDLNQDLWVHANIQQGPYQDVAHYLEVQFRLLWCDFLRPLRTDILQFRKQPESKFNSIQVHKNVIFTQLINENFNENDDSYIKYNKWKLEFSVTDNNDNDDNDDDDDDEDKENKRFLPGSVLYFLRPGTDQLIPAKIIDNYDNNLFNNKTGTAKNKWRLDIITADRVNLRSPYKMLEYKNYYEPYYQVLKCLQSIDKDDFSTLMTKVFVQTDNEYRHPPSYLSENDLVKILCYQEANFNESQLVAWKEALTRDFALIQGPPGTGKTFLALRLVKYLLEIKQLWLKHGPILVVAYKNNSLDNLLEGLLCYTNNITRVGGGCRNQKVEPYTLKNQCEKSSRVNKLSIMSQSLILGMTTTCAARLNSTLQKLKCPIVIIEEAAEVFEAHLLASLTQFCQHLILIGDHQQLRPKPADYELETQFGLDLSLFERMLLNKFPCFTLNEQHRMRPEISKLITPLIYPDLIDGIVVQNRPKIQGVARNLFFITHDKLEDTSGTSKKNSYEAAFLINFAKYLIRNNYKAEQITILATYGAQVDDLKMRVKRNGAFLKNLEVASVDSYQGKENDIVLLSLVRSNRENKIGFLNTINRVCVLLSRARNGFFIIGNMEMLSRKNQFWRNIKSTLESAGSFGPRLPLECSIHENNITFVKTTKDFSRVENGGCSLQCRYKFTDCVHYCTKTCHLIDREHTEEFKCDREECQLTEDTGRFKIFQD